MMILTPSHCTTALLLLQAVREAKTYLFQLVTEPVWAAVWAEVHRNWRNVNTKTQVLVSNIRIGLTHIECSNTWANWSALLLAKPSGSRLG